MAGGTEISEISLSEIFDKALQLHEDLDNSTEDTVSESYQNKVKKGILMLEDATRLVSIQDLFARNENYQEIPTEHLKYFLLPVLLGDLNARLSGGDRDSVVETCQIYYIDFLNRMVDYEFGELKIPRLKEVKKEEQDPPTSSRHGPPDMAAMNAERETKMRRFREKKELESEIKTLKNLVNPGTRDEDLERKLYIKMIKKFVHVAQEEIMSLHMEVDVLRHMAAVKAGTVVPEPVKKSRPFQPIIITKDKIQKEVYGMGYPSLPVLSVDEFYDQRVAEGWFPPAGHGSSLMDKAVNPEEEARQEDEHLRGEDDKEDRDDQEALEKKRGFDEWKDEHRRGEGNRHNMG